jgi:hypothetical protein
VDRVDRVDRAKKRGLSSANLRCSKDIGEVDRVMQKTTLLGLTCVRVCVCVCVCIYTLLIINFYLVPCPLRL